MAQFWSSKTFEEVGKTENFDVISALVEKLQPGGTLGKILADKEIKNCKAKTTLHKNIRKFCEKESKMLIRRAKIITFCIKTTIEECLRKKVSKSKHTKMSV